MGKLINDGRGGWSKENKIRIRNLIKEWLNKHEGVKYLNECAKEIGVTPVTVYAHYKEIKNERNKRG